MIENGKQLEISSITEELKEFKEKTDAFYAGEMDKGAYKSFSGRFGSYAQKGRCVEETAILLCIGCDYSFSSGHRQVHGKAVAAHRNDGNFFFRHVVHNFFLSAALRPPSVDIFSAQRSRSFTQRFSPFRPRWLPSGSPPSGWPISHLFFAVRSRSSPPA